MHVQLKAIFYTKNLYYYYIISIRQCSFQCIIFLLNKVVLDISFRLRRGESIWPKMFAHCILFASTIILILIQFLSCIIYVDFIYYRLRIFIHIHIFMNILSSNTFIYYLVRRVI